MKKYKSYFLEGKKQAFQLLKSKLSDLGQSEHNFIINRLISLDPTSPQNKYLELLTKAFIGFHTQLSQNGLKSFRNNTNQFIERLNDFTVKDLLEDIEYRKLKIDSKKVIDLPFKIKNITGIDMDIDCMVSLIEGSIPLIKDHSVKRVYTEDDGRRYYLILENRKTFETLSFKKGIPDRILLMDKKGKKKIEVYIVKYHWKNNTIYYRKLNLIDEQAKINLDITFSDINMNKAVSLMTETDIAIPQGTKIIRY